MITVVLATFNGADVLPAVLDGYCNQIAPDMPWQIVVVDNASNDQTPALLQSYLDKIPLVVIREPASGKNRALNSALDAIDLSAELFIFSDDDAIPAPDFLVSWAATLANGEQDEIYGGRVELLFRDAGFEKVERFASHFPEIYAQNIRPEGPISADSIFGPNMAVRGWVLRSGCRFEERIGPNSTQADYPMGSETEFCVRAAKTYDLKAQFCREPVVQHIVRGKQMSLSFVRGRAFRHGRGVAMRQQLNFSKQRSLFFKLKLQMKMLVAWIITAGGRLDPWHFAWLQGYTGYLREQN